MDFRIVYVVFVDIDKSGSYMAHVNGFIEGLLGHSIQPVVFGKGSNSINAKFLRFTGLIPKFFAFPLLDLFSAFRIIWGRKTDIYILRPYRFTLLTYTAARICKVNLVQENNGILHDELSRNGLKLQSVLYKFIERVTKDVPSVHVCVSSGILKYYESINVSGELFLSSNGISKHKIYERKSPLAYEDGLRLLFIGKLAPWQGVVQFLDYILRHPNSSITSITVIGNGAEEDLVRELLNNLPYETTFIGWSSWEDIQKHSENCNVGLIPRLDSSICGSPLKMFDYLALGLPIISTEIDGITDVLNNSNLYFRFSLEEESSIEAIWPELVSLKEEDLKNELKNFLNKYEWRNISNDIVKKITQKIQ